METKSINIFSFDELSEKAKEKACSDYRDSGRVDTQWYWDDAIESVKKFHEIFPTKSDRSSWLDFSLEMEYDEMDGFRLQKYIWNNYNRQLFKGRFYMAKKHESKKQIYHPRIRTEKYKNGNIGNYYYSAIQKDNCCVLTGVCYDDDLLGPIYAFLNARNGEKVFGYLFDTMTMQDLIECCFHELKKSLEDEDEYRETDEAISEDFMGNEYKFFESGKICTL